MKFTLQTENGTKLISRGCDNQGCGHYGAPRDGGSRKHKGHDLAITPNTGFKLPFDSYIKRKGLVRQGQPFNLLEVTPLGTFKNIVTFKIMYCDLGQYAVGSEMKKTEVVGISQDVASYYGGGMKNHLHIEAYIFGKRVNPELFLNVQK